MKTHLIGAACALAALATLGLSTDAAAPPTPATKATPADVLTLAKKLDRVIDRELEAQKVAAAPMATDEEYCRRVYLDIAGRIPRVSEVRAFLADKRADRRMKLVESLLAGPNHVNHMTNVWRALLLPDGNNQQVQFLSAQVENWVRSRIRDNVPYDKMVRDLMTAPVAFPQRTGDVAPGRQPDPGAQAFYQANENKPENIAAATSRLFLGVKIECAQCHDHPFAKWTRKQFWEYTAFFAGMKPQNPQAGVFGGLTESPGLHDIEIPGTTKKAAPKFLDGRLPDDKTTDIGRKVLADWMVRDDNPFFARAAANRLWEHFFGVGIVDPVDDFRDDNAASHPEALDLLAEQFKANKYDLRFVIKAITATKAYQRTSRHTDPTQFEIRTFAKMPLKSLTPEQVFDSLATAVGYRGEATGNRFAVANNTPRGEILARFANPVDKRTEGQTSILQALALMNGKFVADATSLSRSETLAAVVDSPFMDTTQKLDTLYLAALGRRMREPEAIRLVAYVKSGGPSRDQGRALADVFWVLLNSSEFILNH